MKVFLVPTTCLLYRGRVMGTKNIDLKFIYIFIIDEKNLVPATGLLYRRPVVGTKNLDLKFIYI